MRRALDDEQFKLINLCRDWLQSVLPHILSKLTLTLTLTLTLNQVLPHILSKGNRVAYGLLSPHDLRAWPHTPCARAPLLSADLRRSPRISADLR